MANGTIAFDTLSTSGQITGTAKSLDTDYVVSGSAKYWITFTQSSNAVGDSFNHTSATDNGTGDHTLAIANDFSSAEHAAHAQHMQESGNSAAGFAVTKARAAGSVQIQGLTNDRSALVDLVFQVSSCGDLA